MSNEVFSIPFITFPSDWQIKFLPKTIHSIAHFLIKKEGAPNIVSVAIFIRNIHEVITQNYWEVAISRNPSGPGITDDGEDEIPLLEIDQLLLSIEKTFYKEKILDTD